MIESEIQKINNKVKAYDSLEICFLSYTNNDLTLAGSEDFCKHHNFEIRFINTFSIISNTTWKSDTSKDLIEEVTDHEEMLYINEKYKIEAGNTIFKLISSEMAIFYIVCKGIEFVDRMVNY